MCTDGEGIRARNGGPLQGHVLILLLQFLCLPSSWNQSLGNILRLSSSLMANCSCSLILKRQHVRRKEKRKKKKKTSNECQKSWFSLRHIYVSKSKRFCILAEVEFSNDFFFTLLRNYCLVQPNCVIFNVCKSKTELGSRRLFVGGHLVFLTRNMEIFSRNITQLL